MQKVRTKNRPKSLPSPENWEGFSSFLQAQKFFIQEWLAATTGENPEPNPQDFIPNEKAKRAWEALKTSENRHCAEEFLEAAAQETIGGVEGKTKIVQALTAQGKQRARQLQKTRKKAEEAGTQFIEALRAYWQATLSVWVLMRPSAIPPLRLSEDEAEEWLSSKTDEREQWPTRVEECVEQVESIVEQLQQIEDHFPLPYKPPGQRPGPQEKQLLNAAILGLEQIFLSLKLSHNKALVHTHSLLYAAGVWADPSHKGLTAKASNLKNLLPSKKSSKR